MGLTKVTPTMIEGSVGDKFAYDMLGNAPINVFDYGAVGDGTTDDLAAFDAAVADLQPWGTLFIPQGEYALSDTWVIENKYRTRIVCQGVIVPHGTFDDYLVKITNSVGDPLVVSMGCNIVVHDLTVDCKWQSRGVWIEGVYDSSFENLHVWRPYGTGIYTPRLQEVSFYKPFVTNGLARTNATILAASDWSSATTYSEGTYVKRNYSAYAGGTTYAAGDIVSSSGFLYRSIKGSNTGNTPSTNADYWERIPYNYYQATSLAGNTNKDPHDGTTDYSTRSGTSGNRYWKPVYADEPVWNMVGTGSTNTSDNCKVWNFITRGNAQDVVVRLDNTENNYPVTKFEFYAPQFHSITEEYITAHNAEFPAYTITAPTNGILVQAVYTTSLRVIGGQFQTGDLDYCKGIMAGCIGKSGNAARTNLTNVQFEATAAGYGNVAMSILPSVNTGGVGWYESNIAMVMSTSPDYANKIDLSGETVTYQTGTATILNGNTSVTFTYPRPMVGAPQLSIIPKTALGGRSWYVSGVTNSQFVVTVSSAVAADTSFDFTAQIATYNQTI